MSGSISFEGDARPFSRRSRRLCFAFVVGAAGCLLSRAALADEAQELDYAKTRFDAGQYEDAAKRFATMLDPKIPACGRGPTEGGCRLVDDDLIERARGMYAASLMALGRPEAEVDAPIEQILRDNPAFSPSPAVFPQELIDRFTSARGRMRDELEAIVRERADRARLERLASDEQKADERKRVAELERLAGQETVVETNSRWIAMLPLGVGQFQNGDTALGVVLGLSQAAAGVTSIVTGVVTLRYSAIDLQATIPLANGTDRKIYDEVAVEDARRTATDANRISFGIWAGLTVLSIVHAQVTFVPERSTTRPRPLPSKPEAGPEVAPSLSVDGQGASLGLVGRF